LALEGSGRLVGCWGGALALSFGGILRFWNGRFHWDLDILFLASHFSWLFRFACSGTVSLILLLGFLRPMILILTYLCLFIPIRDPSSMRVVSPCICTVIVIASCSFFFLGLLHPFLTATYPFLDSTRPRRPPPTHPSVLLYGIVTILHYSKTTLSITSIIPLLPFSRLIPFLHFHFHSHVPLPSRPVQYHP